MSVFTRSRAGVRRLLEDDGDSVISGLLVLLFCVRVRVEDDAGLSEENTGTGVRKTYNCSVCLVGSMRVFSDACICIIYWAVLLENLIYLVIMSIDNIYLYHWDW